MRSARDRQAAWIANLQHVLDEERNLLDAIAESLDERSDLDDSEYALLNEWRQRRGLPLR